MAARIEHRPPLQPIAEDEKELQRPAAPLFAPEPEPAEKGYVERCVVAIRDFVVSIFRKIGQLFCCVAPPKKQRDLEIEYLQPEMQGHIKLMRRLAKLPNQTQAYICMQIGRAAAPNEASNKWLEIGQGKIMENAEVLRTYIKG